MDYRMTINGREERVRIEERGGTGRYQVAIGDRTYEVDAARLRNPRLVGPPSTGHGR